LVASGTTTAQLYGDTGNDSLVGGNGADTLSVGPGLDTMTGGAGLDSFYGYASEFNGDRITDYTAGEKIYLSQNLTPGQVKLVAAANGTDTECRSTPITTPSSRAS
jgi:Ca2+-binding RTX toxin-like protein